VEQFKQIICHECGASVWAELKFNDKAFLDGYHGECFISRGGCGTFVFEEIESKKNKPSFLSKITTLINQYSREGLSNTPDFILAEYLEKCLENYESCVAKRDKWLER
jgi:hypothetical protein